MCFFVPTNTQNRLPADTPEVCFCLLVAPAPKPLFAEFHSSATHRSGAFSPASGGDFLKTVRLACQYNRKLLRKWKRHFFKNPSGSQSRSQRETLFKGFGMLPNKQNLRFPASPGTVVLSVCIYKRPACPVAHGCCFHRPSTKFSPKALTGTSVCATIMGN